MKYVSQEGRSFIAAPFTSKSAKNAPQESNYTKILYLATEAITTRLGRAGRRGLSNPVKKRA
jgi:hypothetical protein